MPTLKPEASQSRSTSIAMRHAWLALAVCLAAAPFAQGFTGNRIFYVRDLSLFFWGRFLWLRRTILSGEWPFWDPYVGAGQAAYEDALHQMFLPPVLLLRLLGSELLSFNLWVALPFPLAAAGAYGFLCRRFSKAAAALGAVAFALAGPVVSAGNFPNMSWSVAAMPWVLWAVDAVAERPTSRRVALLAVAVAFQALAGEPVTLVSTCLLSAAFVAFAAIPQSGSLRGRALQMTWVGCGIALGGLLAAVQLLPMAHAAAMAERSSTIGRDLWSLHPLALFETVSLHLFGDYFACQALVEVPWMPPLNSGREPFFFSIYFGVPLLSLTLFGIAAGGPRRWSTFWTSAGAVALIGAFGVYTPIYPFLRDHLPLLASFRFPVKYLVVVSMAVAAGAAAGWDALSRSADGTSVARFVRARRGAVGVALFAAGTACIIAGLCLYAPVTIGSNLLLVAGWIDAVDPPRAAALMVRTLPSVSSSLMLLAVATAALLLLASSERPERQAARVLLYALIVGDLLVRAWAINPAFDPMHVAEPEWLAYTRDDPNARFYIGGKRDGTLDPGDADSSRRFLNPPGLRGSASRAALSGQTVYYPSAWRSRELLSYDLAVLWPKIFQLTEERFFTAGPSARTRFLERAGVRYRILPQRTAEDRTPLTAIPFYEESFLYDWGASAVAPRAGIVPAAKVVADPVDQLEALFTPGWDSRTTVLVERETPAEGTPADPVPPFAKFLIDRPGRVQIEAGTDAAGGYLLLLDSYADGWQATVDGRPAAIVRANALFRAVRLAPGRHLVEFVYRPVALYRAAALSGLALVAVLLLAWPVRLLPPRASSGEVSL
jgi:hypothetical protein